MTVYSQLGILLGRGTICSPSQRLFLAQETNKHNMRFSLYLHNTVSRREPVFKKQLIITASSSTSYPVLLTPIGINQEQFLISKEKSIILYEVVCKISLSLNLKIFENISCFISCWIFQMEKVTQR